LRIQVKLFITLRQYAREGGNGTFELDCSSKQTVGSFVEILKIPSGVQKVILVNGRHANEETKLFEGDKVTKIKE